LAPADSHLGSSLDLEHRWIVSAKCSRYHPNHPNHPNIYHWESQPTSPPGHLDSERTWTSTAKVSRIAYRDREQIKLSDSTIPLEKGTGVSRIVVHDEKCEDQGLPAPGIPTTSAVAGGDHDHGNDPAGERL